MDFRLKHAMFGLAAAAMTASGAGAATLVVAPDSGCGKTTCFSDAGVYTRTWSAKDFGGAVNISNLLLDRAVLGALSGETFRISFSLNGQEVGVWGRFNMSGLGGETLTFSGQDFVWNPEDGDLVLTLALDLASTGGGGGVSSGFFARSPDVDDSTPTTDDADETAPTQGFRQAAIMAPAPEPASWALMIAGFGLTGAALRARRLALARAG